MLGDDGTQRFTQLVSLLVSVSIVHQPECTCSCSQMLVDRESEKNKWIDALHELHRIIRRNKLPSRNVSALPSTTRVNSMSSARK